MKMVLQVLWRWLRAVTGDDAYEQYLRRHERVHPDVPPLSREAFFESQLLQKWSSVNRCC